MSKGKIIPLSSEKPDVQEMTLDGKREAILSARGVVLFCLSSWRLDRNERARGCLQRYCEYIAMHGYRGGAAGALDDLERLDKEAAASWIKRTFAQHVHDQHTLMQYVMGPISGG